MAISTTDHLLIDGSRYAIRPSGFRRSLLPLEADQLTAKRVQSPFLDSETVGYQGGLGLRDQSDEATAYYAGIGMEPVVEAPSSGNRRLKVGRQLTTWQTTAGVGGFLTLMASGAFLYAGPAVGDDFYRWSLSTDTFTSTLGHATGSGYTSWLFDTTAVVVWYTKGGSANLYATNTTLEHSFSGTEALVLAAYRDTSGLIESFVWLLVYNGGLELWKYATSGAGTATEVGDWGLSQLATAIAVGDTSYIWIRPTGAEESPRAELWTWNTGGAAASGTKTALAFNDNWPVSACYYRGDIYLGMAWGGRIYKQTGAAELQEVLRIGNGSMPASSPGTDAIYAMCVHDDSLYAAGYDASAASGQRTWVRRYDGEGWHLISVGGDDASIAIRSMTSFLGSLVLGDQEATDGKLYQLSLTSRLTSAVLEGANVTYGAPTIQKRFRSISLQHTALVAGQKVDVRYKLDDGSEVTTGVNQDVGSTETVFELPYTVKGTKLRPLFYLTNVAGSDLIVASHAVRALAAPQTREVWEVALSLKKRTFNDATADSLDATTKYDNLAALWRTGQPVQVVEPLRDGSSLPLHAMLAVFDPQSPLDAELHQLTPDLEIVLPVRLLQASGQQNLVKNASFEQDGNAAAPTDWGTVIGAGTSALTDNGAAQDGTYSLKVIHNGVGTSYGRSQSVSGLIPGRYYTISAYIKRTTWATALANPRVDVFESGILTSGNSVGPGAGASTDSAFVRYSQTFLLPTTSSGTVLVRAFADGTPANGSTVLFDAIQLEEGSPVSTFRERGSGG